MRSQEDYTLLRVMLNECVLAGVRCVSVRLLHRLETVTLWLEAQS